jgi:cardiolipin synthase A/B
MSRRRQQPQARSEPGRYRQAPRRWRRRLLPDPRFTPLRWKEGWWRRTRRLLLAWWPWAVASGALLATDHWLFAGLFAGLATVLHLAGPLERPLFHGLVHRFEVADPEFRHSLEGITGAPFIEGNSLSILHNGDGFYPAMLDAIRQARRSITMEMYIFWESECGMDFARALAERARQKVPVKILLDAVGSATIGDRILAELERGGCHVGWYNPIEWYTLSRFNNRTHRKTLIVDGTVAFTGGAGIADQWCGNAEDRDHWRDVQVAVEGPGSTVLQTGFAQNWLKATGQLVSGEEFFPRIPAAGNVAAQVLLSSPGSGASNARMLHYFAIVCAVRSIDIANPYFIPDEAAVRALGDARSRGVRVRVLAAGISNDNWLARHNSVRLFGDLLKRGVEIYEYNRTLLHHKAMIVDERFATIGTANFDNRSFAYNEENNVSFTEPRLIAELKASFDADLAMAVPVTLRAWRERGLFARAEELVASVLQDQI